ncbi:MAG TPA: HIT domain-containing protein [Pseudidiomarina sp.]|nr:HIT domain-containing protein [Pseudidiomarina sp.]
MTNLGYNKFALDARLAQDTIELGERGICRVLRFDDQRYDWFVLVPQRAGCVEVFDLSEPEQAQLALDIRWAATTLKEFGSGSKLNIGALGNVVSQLHIHIVLRSPRDPAWPGPVWGHSAAQRFNPADAAIERRLWQQRLAMSASE